MPREKVIYTYYFDSIKLSDLKAELQKHKIVIVKFTAIWCHPCKIMCKELNKVSKVRKNIRIVEIDVDENETAWKRYNISGIPTCFLFKNGKKVGRRLTGAEKKDEIHAWIDKCLE